MPCRWACPVWTSCARTAFRTSCARAPATRADPGLDSPEQLPLASHSVDLVVLPHVLEFAQRPHQILREAERVLIPEGQLVICGFNPLSPVGHAQAPASAATFGRNKDLPWNGRFIGLPRLKDWLALLGFELNGGKFGCYAPPFAQTRWLERSAFMEKAGDRWWPIAGGVYVVRGVKRQEGIRLVTPPWREPTRPSSGPRAGAGGAARQYVNHVRPIQRR